MMMGPEKGMAFFLVASGLALLVIAGGLVAAIWREAEPVTYEIGACP